ncbi:MAG: agmatinase [Candidatus Helarchaeota archaeon]
MVEFNFSQLELADNTEFIILGIPIDCTSAKPTDSRNGQKKIREVSNQFADYTELGFDLNSAIIFDAGNVEVKNERINIESDLREIDKKINSFKNLKDLCFIGLGGDHFITYPIFRNLLQKHENIGIISFDAHLDLYNMWYEAPYSNATVMRRIAELPEFNLNNISYVGIRDIDLEELEFLKKYNLEILKAFEITDSNLKSVISKNIQRLKKNKVKDLYVTIDIDVLDLPYAPGTGYRIPGGLSFRQLWRCLKVIAKNFNIKGFDIVEVAPSLDSCDLTSVHAARLVLEFIGMIKNRYYKVGQTWT